MGSDRCSMATQLLALWESLKLIQETLRDLDIASILPRHFLHPTSCPNLKSSQIASHPPPKLTHISPVALRPVKTQFLLVAQCSWTKTMAPCHFSVVQHSIATRLVALLESLNHRQQLGVPHSPDTYRVHPCCLNLPLSHKAPYRPCRASPSRCTRPVKTQFLRRTKPKSNSLHVPRSSHTPQTQFLISDNCRATLLSNKSTTSRVQRHYVGKFNVVTMLHAYPKR